MEACFSCQWTRNFKNELQCKGEFDVKQLTSTVLNVLLLAKMAGDLIMMPLCWTLLPDLNMVWGSGVTFYSFSLALLNDCNVIVIKATSIRRCNELPYGLFGILLIVEVILFSYDGVFFLNRRIFNITNGILFTLCIVHIALRVLILVSYKKCPVVRLEMNERDAKAAEAKKAKAPNAEAADPDKDHWKGRRLRKPAS